MKQNANNSKPPTPRPFRLPNIILIACLLSAVVTAGTLALSGCARTEAGLSREAALYHLATNTVAGAHQVTPYLPPPAQFPVDLALGLITAALAAWNTHQQVAIRKLKNGQGTRTKPIPSPGPAPPPAPAT